MSDEVGKPAPVPDDLTEPFWRSAAAHILRFQRCVHCGRFSHPPEFFCRGCHNLANPAFDFATVTPRGRIINWTVIHDAMVQGFDTDVPWVHALVAFDDQPELTFTATVIGGETEDLEIGMPVEVVFKDLTPEISLPVFRIIRE